MYILHTIYQKRIGNITLLKDDEILRDNFEGNFPSKITAGRIKSMA